MGPDLQQHVAAIYNAAWSVRHNRLGRTAGMRAARELAIQTLGRIVREAFVQCDDFEPLLTAIVNGLSPQERQDI